MDYFFLFEVALILFCTKVFSIGAKILKLPQVVGALLAGLVLGPAMLGILEANLFLDQISEIGVIALMFAAGLETDIQELKKTGKASFVIALFGVLVPLAGGYFIASLFNIHSEAFLQNVFIGVVLTATSVSITVETLKEMGKLSTKSGNAILGAALIDDILGIIALTIITSMADSSVKVGVVMFKIVAFFALSTVVGVFLHKRFNHWFNRYTRDKKRFPIMAFVFCLNYAFIAEHFFGVADITGAFFAGLVLSNTRRVAYVASRMEILSFMFLSPIFFANIGLKVVLPHMTSELILFSVLLMLVAVISKIVGCGIGAKMCGFSNHDSLCVGTGMISRGEVALIVASKGMALGLMNPEYYAPIIITVVVTTVITPILLKLVYRNSEPEAVVENKLADFYNSAADLEALAQALSDDDMVRYSARHQQ